MTGVSLAQGWRIIARGFRAVYDYAGTVMLISTFWAFLGFFPTMLAFLVLVQVPHLMSILIFGLLAVTLLGPMTAGVYSVADAILQGDEVLVRDYWGHFTRHYKRAAVVTAVIMIILGILAIDVLFFWLAGTTLTRMVSAFFAYLILFWFMAAQFVFPLIVRRSPRLLETLKMAALLALDNIVVSLMVVLAGAVVVAISSFLRVPIMLFMAGTLGFLQTAALDELLRKYSKSRTDSDGAEKES